MRNKSNRPVANDLRSGGEIKRAAAFNLVSALLGVVLFFQTQNIAMLIAGIAIGTAVLVAVCVKKLRERLEAQKARKRLSAGTATIARANRQGPQKRVNAAAYDPASREHSPEHSNVTPFRRPAVERTTKQSSGPIG